VYSKLLANVQKAALVCSRWGCRRVWRGPRVVWGPRRRLYAYAGPRPYWGPAWGWSTWGWRRPGWGWNRW
jgi:hypothetical protein